MVCLCGDDLLRGFCWLVGLVFVLFWSLFVCFCWIFVFIFWVSVVLNVLFQGGFFGWVFGFFFGQD